MSASICSFLLAEWLARDHPMIAYYMLPTRAGELLLGVLVYALEKRGLAAKIPAFARQLLSLAGLGAIGWSMFALSGSSVFPGLLAIPATAGTAAIILTGAGGSNLVGRALSLKPFVWIGLLSYSLYLWHWPVLAYLKYLYIDLSLVQLGLAAALTFGLSIASFYLIETPVRRSNARVQTHS